MGGVVLFTRVALPPLWIADQVRNDVTPFPTLWIPAYAGMTVRQVCGAYRHCGLDPQSRGVGCVAAVILASRQYPQGGVGMDSVLSESGFSGLGRCVASFSPSHLIPLSSRERGILSVGLDFSPTASPLDCGSSPQ